VWLLGGLFSVVGVAAETEMGDLTIATRHYCIGLRVELAITPEARRTGLQHRTSLPHHGGMLFINPQPRTTVMWMLNTPISLDMLFINTNGQVVHIAEHTTPESRKRISSGVPVKAVLEIAAGRADEFGIRVGDKVALASSP
jgi:uncharacterized membrane protein (UPF0127 family)